MTRRGEVADAEAVRPFKRGASGVASGREFSTTAGTSRRMGKVRQRGTAPELIVRRALRRIGLRYRLRNRDLPGSPDLANRSRQFAVFVHGCFWHQHPQCPRATTPKRNRAFWVAKFAANRARDDRSVEALRQLGYTVLIVWECETADPDALTAQLTRGLFRHGR